MSAALRLRVAKDRYGDRLADRWYWQIHTGPTTLLGYAPSQPVALAVGLAALEAASLPTAKPSA